MSQDSTGGVQANNAGAAFRAALNVSLAAIITLNSGASAPATTYAYMFWADTTTGLLKQRDSLNASWIVVGNMGAAYLGLLQLAGGNMTGAVNYARTTVASAAGPDIWTGTGNNINYTGTVTATGFAAAPQAGASRILDCAAAAVFTAGANMVIDGVASGANLTVAAGDRVTVFARTTTQFVLQWIPSGGVTPVSKGQITGLLPTAISGTSTTAAVTISSGQAADSTGARMLTGPGHNWAVSNGNAANGFDGGTTLPNSSTVHWFECYGSSGYCSFASTSLTPVFPAGYNSNYRRIFSLNTNSSGALIPGTAIETEGGAVTFWLGTQVADIAAATPTAVNRTLYTLSVPQGIKVQPLGRQSTTGIMTGQTFIATSPDEADVAPLAINTAGTPAFDVGVNSSSVWQTAGMQRKLTTNTSGQIGFRSNATQASSLTWITSGFVDFRRA